MFDPNAPMLDFESQQKEIERQRLLAAMMRKNVAPVPQGQMVSGHYVAPAWTQNLATLFDQYQSGQAERNVQNQQSQLDQRIMQGANQWRSALPQAVEATQAQAATPFGSRDAPQQDATQGSPAVPVTQAQALKYALEGIRNPRTRDEAALYHQVFREDLNREDKQADSKAARELAAETSRQNKLDSLGMQLQQLQVQSMNQQLSREQHAQLAQMADATRREIAAASNATAQQSLQQRGEENTRRFDADRKQDLTQQTQHFATATKALVPAMEGGRRVQSMLDTYGDKKIPGIGHSMLIPDFMNSAEGTQNRAAINQFATAMMVAEAGLSQTLSEQERQKITLLTKPDFSEKDFRTNWPWMRDKVNSQFEHQKSAISPQAMEYYYSNGGNLRPIAPAPKDAPPKPAAAPRSAPPTVVSGADGSSPNDQVRFITSEYMNAKDPAVREGLARELKRLNAPVPAAPMLPQAMAQQAGTAQAQGPMPPAVPPPVQPVNPNVAQLAQQAGLAVKNGRVVISLPADAAKLPPGTPVVLPDGRLGTVPGAK